ncbi:MAG: beta-aspartyl-peptidase, partial [Firmicutes bacterium]|nr:beta-aspartyl-peptidase [Bacillota bacterium]
MNLELRKVQIKDIVFDTEMKIIDGVLHVDPKKLEELVLEDRKVKSVSFDIARPGESVRIVPVKDVIEPRAKLEGGDVFPGLFKEDMQEAGEGITYCLKGMAVTSTGPIVGFQEGVIDMSGPCVDYTIYSSILHLCMIIEKQDYVDPHDHEEVVRLAGIK